MYPEGDVKVSTGGVSLSLPFRLMKALNDFEFTLNILAATT